MCKPTNSPRHHQPVRLAGNHRRAEKQAWWKASVARRTASFLEDEVDSRTSGCHFFSQVEENENIMKLKRNQIQIHDKLGQGAFSEVHSVSILDEDGSSVLHHDAGVMKHLKADLLSNPKRFHQAAADLILETKFLSRLDHPNIIKIKGYAADGISSFSGGKHDSYFIVLEEVQMTLGDRIRQWKHDDEEEMESSSKRKNKNRVSHLEEKIQYSIQIANAIEYLHNHNIIYRDLKPDNIGITADGTIKLLDFGLCRVLPDTIDNNVVVSYDMQAVGTRRYMAPETCLREGYNLKADVYGLAIVLFELFAVKKPFDLYSRDMHKHFVCLDGIRPTLPKYWPKDLSSMLATAWHPKPSKRPTISDICCQLEEIRAATAKTTSTRNSSEASLFLKLFRQPFAHFVGGEKGKKIPNDLAENNSTESSTGRSIVSAVQN